MTPADRDLSGVARQRYKFLTEFAICPCGTRYACGAICPFGTRKGNLSYRERVGKSIDKSRFSGIYNDPDRSGFAEMNF